MVETKIVHYFCEADIISCPIHYEAKTLANKYWNQLNTIGHKCDKALDEITDPAILSKKLIGLADKYDKVDREFQGVMRGLAKCCYTR